MKHRWLLGSMLLALVGLAACQDDSANAGASALENENDIRVKADTFAVQSALKPCPALTLTPDSFLLGECDTHFGTLKADVLTQFACPVGFSYPDAEQIDVDSVCLFMYYTNSYGDRRAPLGITVYEIDRASMQYNERYSSDVALEEFCSLEDSTHIAHPSRIVVAAAPTDSVYSSAKGAYVPFVRIRLSDEFARRFFQIRSFETQEQFNEQFKGLYITTDFGGGTILYINDISMAVYYHFNYPQTSREDTTLTDIKAFYANSEVRQINRYVYPDRENVLQELSQHSDTNYIVAPANIYTRLSVRMDSIYSRIEQQLGNSDDYRVYVNRANLTVDVLYDAETSSRPRDNWDTPSSYMLLIKESNLESFFAHNELPSDTSAILGTLTAITDSLSNVTYSYSYDLSTLLTNQLRSDNRIEALDFVLVPVAVTTSSSSSSTITAIKQLQTVSATRIRSAANPIEPMDIEVVYAGFDKGRKY